MKSISTLALATALSLPLVFALPACAQSTAPAAAAPAAAMPAAVMPVGSKAQPSEMAEGEIRKVSKDTGKLTIKHGPIKSLDMPPMTMVFTAKNPALLDKVAVGDKVRFVAVDEGGQMLVTDIQPAK